MDQYHYHTVQTQSSDSSDSSEPETHSSCSSSSYDSSNASTDSESEYADITGILMATETVDPSASTSTPIVDDNPSDQASQTEPIPPPLNAQPQTVLREFMARSTGSLRDWLESLGEYRQLQFMESPVSTTLNIIHEQFIGEKTASTEANRKEYHQMKCCSLKRHLLDAHYKRMSILFYKLNGFNEPSLKHVFIASLPPELQPDLQRKLTATNLSIADISLGKIFQMAMLSLDKICEQKEFFKDLMEDKKPFSEACKKPYLKIECKDEKKCVCPITKKRHFRKHFHRKSSSKKPFQYFKKKDSTQDDQTAFLIAESSDSEDIFVISTVQTVNHVSTIPRPSLKMSILPSKFHKPIPVIGFIDTGADTSMIDPSVLPSDSWEPHSKLFRVVNGETFETTLITKKPIGIQFFPNCIIWKKIVASKLPDKDLLIGFDILHLVKNLFLTSSGVQYKQMFLPYTDTLRLYALLETPSPYSHISQKLLEFCPENHSQFHHPSPLWKNEQFFIHLPFKLNEDINPTKASHPGMSPSDLLLAKQECSQLLQQVRGKKRLVIDYQPLNSFLKDDKFPLPKIQTLFVHLQGARIFSKFDLKVGFWQLGISLVDLAPSLFQKAMTKIFSPILHHALVYIDDILLFSSNHESHQKLLLDFFHIVQAHGIMLSEKKSSIGKESIDFLGMTEAVKQLKVIAQSPPLLRIPTSGQRILQTDASDDYWSAILLEDINGVRHFYAHASGQFKDFEKNYHVIYKEILAVKYGIKKFEFHLISHKFLINMDNSSFPCIFDFKNKLLPDKQLLSLKTWFAKYDFTVQHIKGNQNLIPDFLTRPVINKPALISSIQTIPVIAMNRQLPFKALNQRNFPMNIFFQSAYQLQDFAKKFLYRFFFNLCTFHGLDKMPEQEANMWTTAFIVHKPYFQHPETRDYWTQDMAYEWRTYPHPYTFIHDTSVTSVLKAYLMELNNVPPPATDIHHTSIGPSHTLKIIPKTQGCTPGSSSSPHGILVMEQRPDYTNVLFQDAQDPWEDFQSLLHTDTPYYTVTNPDSPAPSTSQHMSEVDEEKYQQAEAYLDQRQRRRHKRQYEKDTGDVSPSRYPSTP
ncbi:hypothetical protein KPL70_011686 [Citrus sinensis]|nr:hypothetical protein KPL70_011686 [Citrus sinensis]